ncbi:MotA/TolQ/ExbB proton channel family protein [Craterilacuibacter sinensis]|uniref:Biopolymer transport protein ExbB n=1 Tax=Craterilacuibacter sinensis TaxID=2686017 RepID=A0A845BKJ8_9NEIS|nr:MotA/TolQ/ExbB proton channel family protein [Craterilacuibacter sinensis]MXR35920.1 biopolymer transporter ExbB [Craterilacuibacter sinensis]RQW27091.1 MotA/TolQ/ExbB proton channel family protein [Rhodobacteraceae bacterium CH30]
MNLMLVFQQGDAVLTSVFLCLIVMSILTWTLIVLRSLQLWRTRRANAQVEKAVWAASDWRTALNTIADSPAPLAQLAREGVEAASHYRVHAGQSLGQACGLDEYLTRALRRGLMREAARLESGMTLLASVGSTAPFVGLFGTVWGIYHALVGIGASGQAGIDVVAGPIGEALVATAAGLAAAIPAVLAYNAFTRLQRVQSQQMDHFAHDLHAQLLTSGGRSDGVR